MAQYHAPSYLVGIDLKLSDPFHSKAYIAAIKGGFATGMSSIPTLYELNEENLIGLKDEVVRFWEDSNLLGTKNVYKSVFEI